MCPSVTRMQVVERFRRMSTGTTDVIVAVLVAIPTIMDAWWNAPGTRQADAVTYALVAVSIAALLVRRRWPILVTVVAGMALSVLYVLGHHGEMLNLPVMVGLYTIAAQGDRRTTVVVAVVAATWSGILGYTSDDPIGARGGSPVLEMIWPLVPLALGEAARARRQLLTLAEADRERTAQARVEEERARMGRELHDVLAHTMAAVNVQMAAAVAAFDVDPDKARTALQQARASTRSALRELRAAVSVHDSRRTAPAPRLDQLDRLVATVEAAGIGVTVVDERNGAELSDALELTAYRIVQEALTNVLRHSGADHVSVSLRPADEGLVVEVVDDGIAGTEAAAPTGTGGAGLTGMVERARSVGGTAEHGPLPDGGHRVRAVLPIDGESP